MTGDEIVALVRENYGDADTNFLDDAALQDWVNEAVQQIYTMLPLDDMREVVNEDTISLTSGRGDVPSTWDKVISIYTTDEGEFVEMPSHITNAIQGLSDYFTPDMAGYAIDGNEILVTPDTIATVTAQYVVQPDEITTFSNEVTGIPVRYHYAVADFATSLYYASEEDVQQAAFYADRATRAVAGRLPRSDG